MELCAGFGNEGLAIISKAVEGKASVGAVRFDFHPGFQAININLYMKKVLFDEVKK